MEKITISFKEDVLLSELISRAAPLMKKKKGEFIRFCIVQIVKSYIPVLYEQFIDGTFPEIEIPED